MTFSDFLNADSDNSNEVIEYYLNFLTEFSSKEFPYDQELKLKGSAEKFINTIDKVSYLGREKVISYMDAIGIFSLILKQYRDEKDDSKFVKLFFRLHPTNITLVRNEFEKVYLNSLSFINEHNKAREYRSKNIDMKGFYDTKITNKDKIKELIEEAIVLINQEPSITLEIKKELSTHLKKVIDDLDRKNTDWTKVIGTVKQIVIILGAISQFIGNVGPIFTAKEKLEETSEVVEKTSINLNHTTINQTFVIRKTEQLNTFNQILIEKGVGD